MTCYWICVDRLLDLCWQVLGILCWWHVVGVCVDRFWDFVSNRSFRILGSCILFEEGQEQLEFSGDIFLPVSPVSVYIWILCWQVLAIFCCVDGFGFLTICGDRFLNFVLAEQCWHVLGFCVCRNFVFWFLQFVVPFELRLSSASRATSSPPNSTNGWRSGFPWMR